MLDLSRLSIEQRHVVLAPDGPLLIIAGPGSGKTMVVAAKIAYLVMWRQVPPATILALAFATKAAWELRVRLHGLLGARGGAVDVSTFHAFGLRIIRHWSEELWLGPGAPAAYGESEARAVLRDVVTTLQIDLDRYPLQELSATLQRLRLGSTEMTKVPDPLRCVADAYEETLRRRGAVDYPAMLVLPLRLFSEHPRALRICQDRYRVILCDEFQDICASQYALLRSLAGLHRHVVAVGDPQQTLYGWRGADIRFLDAFRRDFAETRIMNLSQNFRSTRQIVDLANALGASLPASRMLWTDNAFGGAIRFHMAADEQAEAAFVAEEIGRLVAERIIDGPHEVAILYRTHWQALPFTLALQQRGLPYRSARRDVPERADMDSDSWLTELRLDASPACEADDTEGVRLTTIHRAKGGEWRVVFVVGMEEGLLPHARSVAARSDEQAGLDEERCVAYVAVTRAREYLYLTYCRTRRRGDRIELREPSRFLRGLTLRRAARTA
jgi:DNA helicase-2/ATP-dependent DNA helicase PcrA